MVGRIVEKHTPAENYPTTDVATYLQFRCNYCLKKFYLVEPDIPHVSGGAIQKEVLARDIETREISKVGRMFPACMRCIQEAIWREKNKGFLLG